LPAIVEAIVVGIVQGLTEFLPVSSSGHLVVVPNLLGWDEPSLAFDLVLHLGTLLAVVVYFWDDLWRLAASVFARGRQGENGGGEIAEGRRMLGYLIVGTIPAGLAGLAFDDFFEDLFDKPLWVCLFWAVTALILVVAEAFHRRAAAKTFTWSLALAVGMAQAVALAPGISRSGATIALAIAVGVSRTEAARFSFLLAVPAIVGAALATMLDVSSPSVRTTIACRRISPSVRCFTSSFNVM